MAKHPDLQTGPREHDNILLILTDQQNANMMGCAPNPHVHTPAIDSLAAGGVRFQRAYCTDPVCVPSRFSLMTGRMPSEIGLRDNYFDRIPPIPHAIAQNAMGHLMRNAGYEVAYGGKEHLPQMTAESIGFDYITSDERDGLADACAKYIAGPHDRPFLLVASFINPHDICYMAIRDFMESDHDKRLIGKADTEIRALDEALKLPPGIDEEEFFDKYCPPLPPNFEIQQDEPEAIRTIQAQRTFKDNARRKWSPQRWRMHRWAYARLTQMVDAQIGKLLNALRENDLQDNTVVIFSSDHGDMDSAHRMEHKTALYDEACRIPLIISRPGKTPPATVNDTHLVSNGLDLLPTLLDYAGATPPDHLKGRSLRPLAEGDTPDQWRSHVMVESEFGKMAVTDRYKYMLYDEGLNREQLIDLQTDPFETRNAASDADKQTVLAAHRQLIQPPTPNDH